MLEEPLTTVQEAQAAIREAARHTQGPILKELSDNQTLDDLRVLVREEAEWALEAYWDEADRVRQEKYADRLFELSERLGS